MNELNEQKKKKKLNWFDLMGIKPKKLTGFMGIWF